MREVNKNSVHILTPLNDTCSSKRKNSRRYFSRPKFNLRQNVPDMGFNVSVPCILSSVANDNGLHYNVFLNVCK